MLLVPKYLVFKTQHTCVYCILLTFRYMYMKMYIVEVPNAIYTRYIWRYLYILYNVHVCVGMYMKVRHQCSHSLMCVNMHVLYMHTVYIPVHI